MTKRNRRTIAEAVEGHNAREQERQDTLRRSAREEQEAAQERDQERAREIVEEHKERRPAPPKKDKYGNLLQKPANDTEHASLGEVWQAYERALPEHEARRLQMAAMGLIPAGSLHARTLGGSYA